MDYMMIIGKLFVAVYVTFNVASTLILTRSSIIVFLFGKNYTASFACLMIITLVLVSGGACIAICVPDILVYFKIIGGIFCPYFTFICAAMFYSKTRSSKLKKGIVWIIGFLMFAIGISVTADAFV
jgi:hypothetical protein